MDIIKLKAAAATLATFMAPAALLTLAVWFPMIVGITGFTIIGIFGIWAVFKLVQIMYEEYYNIFRMKAKRKILEDK